MTRIHVPTDLTKPLNGFDDSVEAQPDQGAAGGYAALAAAVSVGGAALTQVLYLTETGTTSAISNADINQGQIGDCFLLSSIGEIAMLKPTAISNMIHVNANGTQTVMLFEASNSQLPGYGTTAYKAVSETVTDIFPTYAVNNGSTQDVLGESEGDLAPDPGKGRRDA